MPDILVLRTTNLFRRFPLRYLMVRFVRTKEVASVQVLWRNQFVEEATWEAPEDMKKRYPNLFESREIPN